MAEVSRKTPALIVALMMAVMATVLVIGPAVQAANTDVSISDYSQCTDGTADDNFKACTGWINGILNAQNSTYHEDEVTPQRLLLKIPKGATVGTGTQAPHSIDLTYLTRKGSASAHAYDSLATFDYTQTDANRCQSLQNCPSPGSDVPSVETPIPSDPTAVPPATTHGNDASTAFRELPQADRQLQFFGPVASATAPGPITHSSAASPSTDDYATLTVNYVLDASIVDTNTDGKVDATTYVQLVFGGHLAASGGLRSWGLGLGAANINGGPYHIRVTRIDATAIGNRDNQITSGAILPIETTVVTELHQTTAAGADLNPANNGLEISAKLPADGTGTIYVVDHATVNPIGTSGSVDFRYYDSVDACNLDTTGTGGTGAGNDKPVDNVTGVATSDITSFASAGTFWWKAFYTGQDIQLPSFSACNEILTITQDTSTSTLLHETDSTGTDVSPANNAKTITVSPGAYVKDEATVSPSTATGSVAFQYYAGTTIGGVTKTALENCTDNTNGTTVATDTFSGGTAFSDAVPFATAGTFYWRAFFTGTGSNNSSSSPCDEILTVQKASPTLASAPSLIPQDSATLAGILAGGTGATLTFELYAASDTTCAGTPVFTQTVSVTGNGAYATTNSGNPSGANDNTAFRLTSGSPTGTYNWKVVYSGDQVNNGNTKACGLESFTFTGITDSAAS